MICFEVWINGIKKHTIGYDEAEEYGVHLRALPKINSGSVLLDISGFLQSGELHPNELNWGRSSQNISDEITIKIIESSHTDKPQITKYNKGIEEKSIGHHSMLCSNCGKSHFEIEKLISSSNLNLCEDCIKSFAEMLLEKNT